MKRKISLGFILLSFLASNYLFAQSSTPDSLWKAFKNAKHDSTRIQLYLEIGNIYKNSVPDSAEFFYQKAIDLADHNKTNKTSFFEKNKATALRYIGMLQRNQGLYTKAMDYYYKSIKIAKEIGDKKGESWCYNNIGLVYSDQGSNDKAVEYYLKSLKIAEDLDDKKGMSMCYNNIGNIHRDQKLYDKAVFYFLKALKLKEELVDKKGMSLCYRNIGIVYDDQRNHNKALEFYMKSLKICEEINDKQEMSGCYNNIGTVYYSKGSYDQARLYFLKALQILEELGSKNEIGACYNNLGSLNITLADSAALNEKQKINYLNNAIDFGTKALELAIEIQAIPRKSEAAMTLMIAYKKLGNHKKAVEFSEIFIATKDSLFSEEKTKALTEMSLKYEAEKKQLEIEKMQKQKELDNRTIEAQQAENRKQQIVIFSIIGGFLIVLVFSIFLFRMFREKRKANLLLEKQNFEIQQKNEEISTQRDEIETQRDLVYNQKEQIEYIHKKVTDSINYAKRIQEAVLPSKNLAESIFGDHFILFKPKDVVSGDFYWGTRVKEWLTVTVADCTGHGVPGAFMSMLGISFLNEIVRKKEITKACDVLDLLRESIIEALQQKGQSGEQKDGMDIALCSININNLQMQFAGANNSVYIVRKIKDKSEKIKDENKELYTNDIELTELKGDKMPVGIHDKKQSFTNHIFQLHKDDTLYMMTDGLADQFGGPEGKKFLKTPIKTTLTDNCHLPLKDQKEKINSTLEDWKNFNSNKFEQIDDVTILGLKI